MRVSEIIRGLCGAVAIVWTAVMLIPIVNMGVWAFAGYPYTDFLQLATGIGGATLGLFLVVVFDWLLLRLAVGVHHTTNVIHVDNVQADIKVQTRRKSK